jgi:DNA-binding NtrC family response regulator
MFATTPPASLRTGRILIVDDETKILKLLSRYFSRQGHDVRTTTEPQEALRLVRTERYDVLVLDHRMPGLTGLEVFKRVLQIHEDSPPEIILMTAHATVEKAVETMKLGAVDYIQKPFDFDSMKEAVRKALERRDDRRQQRERGERQERPYQQGRPEPDATPSSAPTATEERLELLGESAAMKELRAMVDAVAATDSTVLISGETGTGKELVAAAIHRQSLRRSKPLVRVNCAAIPEGLLESEMFGYVRGAFTGATQNRRGKFVVAHGGSLFLDEISGLSPSLQQKLLRVLQEKEFEPLGSDRTTKVDVRILAATNRDLAELTRAGEFQEDLFYRLNVIPVRVPPLRERTEDIPLLARSFLARFSTKLGKSFRDISPEALGRLAAYDWPGNVRELENAVERAVALGSGPTVLPEDLCDLGEGNRSGPSLPTLDLHENLGWITRQTIMRSLEKVNGRKKDAAALLGISQRALSYYLRKYQI